MSSSFLNLIFYSFTLFPDCSAKYSSQQSNRSNCITFGPNLAYFTARDLGASGQSFNQSIYAFCNRWIHKGMLNCSVYTLYKGRGACVRFRLVTVVHGEQIYYRRFSKVVLFYLCAIVQSTFRYRRIVELQLTKATWLVGDRSCPWLTWIKLYK